MRRIAVFVLLFSLIAAQALAIAPVQTAMFRDAQEYGRRQAEKPYSAFVAPWTAFEEKAQKLSQFTDHAQIFTPYLLVAVNARENTLRRQPLRLEDSEKALAAYDGYLVFSVTVFSEKAYSSLAAKLSQDKQTLPAYYISPPVRTTYSMKDKTLASVQAYVYFPDKTIAFNRPLFLQINDPEDRGRQTRTFFFDLEKLL